MTSDVIKFYRFLEYLTKNDSYYESITKVSSSDDGKSLVTSKHKILNFDELCKQIAREDKKPASMDGLYFKFNKKQEFILYFIEFKGFDLNTQSFKNYFKENILSLFKNKCGYNNENCPIDDLDKNILKQMYETYDDEITSKLRLKPVESLFVVLPQLYEKYLAITNEDSIDSLNCFLSKINCQIIIVHDISSKNKYNEENTLKNRLNPKYSSLKRSGIIKDFRILSSKSFKKNYIDDFEKFPISFISLILEVMDEIIESNKKYSNDSNFKKIISDLIKEKNEIYDFKINEKQEVKLIEIIIQHLYNEYNYFQ